MDLRILPQHNRAMSKCEPPSETFNSWQKDTAVRRTHVSGLVSFTPRGVRGKLAKRAVIHFDGGRAGRFAKRKIDLPLLSSFSWTDLIPSVSSMRHLASHNTYAMPAATPQPGPEAESLNV